LSVLGIIFADLHRVETPEETLELINRLRHKYGLPSVETGD
jgi:hypothetical protein